MGDISVSLSLIWREKQATIGRGLRLIGGKVFEVDPERRASHHDLGKDSAGRSGHLDIITFVELEAGVRKEFW